MDSTCVKQLILTCGDSEGGMQEELRMTGCRSFSLKWKNVHFEYAEKVPILFKHADNFGSQALSWFKDKALKLSSEK